MTQEALTNQQYINCLCFMLAFHATLGHVLVYGLDWPRAWVDFRHGLSLDGWPVWPDSFAEPIWMQACSTSYVRESVWDDASMGHIALSGVPASCSSPRTIFNKGHRELYQNLYSYFKIKLRIEWQPATQFDHIQRILHHVRGPYRAGIRVSLIPPYKMYDTAILRLKK